MTGTYQGSNMVSAPFAHSSTSEVKPTSEDATAERLSVIWQEQLGVDSVSPDQNFFDLGGDSSLAVRMFSAGGNPTTGIASSFVLHPWSRWNCSDVPRTLSPFRRGPTVLWSASPRLGRQHRTVDQGRRYGRGLRERNKT